MKQGGSMRSLKSRLPGWKKMMAGILCFCFVFLLLPPAAPATDAPAAAGGAPAAENATPPTLEISPGVANSILPAGVPAPELQLMAPMLTLSIPEVTALYYDSDRGLTDHMLFRDGSMFYMYSGFPLTATYLPMFAAVANAPEQSHVFGTFGNLNDQSPWRINGNGASCTVLGQDIYVESNRWSVNNIKLPSGSMVLYRAPGLSALYSGEVIQFGLNRGGELAGGANALKSAADTVFDRAFVMARDSNNNDAPYQMKMVGNWAVETDPTEIATPATYTLTPKDDFKNSWSSKITGDVNDFWDRFKVEAKVGYIIKDFDLPKNMTLRVNSISVDEVISSMPASVGASFVDGFDDPSNGKTYPQDINVTWEVAGNDSSITGDTVLAPGDRITLEMHFDRNLYSFSDFIDPETGNVTVTIAGARSSSGSGSASPRLSVQEASPPPEEEEVLLEEEVVKFISGYHFDSPTDFCALPGQTWEEVGVPKTVTIDYYTSDGESGSETAAMEWTLVDGSIREALGEAGEGKDSYNESMRRSLMNYSDLSKHPYLYELRNRGFNDKYEGEYILLEGQAKGLSDVFMHAAGVEPPRARVSVAGNWLGIDVSQYTDLSMQAQNGSLTVSGQDRRRQNVSATYDLNEYTGIRLYATQADYPLKSSGVGGTLLLVENQKVNLWLDHVDIKSAAEAQPLIDIRGNAGSVNHNGASFKPHTAGSDKASLWYPDVSGGSVASSLLVYCDGENSLTAARTGKQAIAVNYYSMLGISGINGPDGKLTLTGGDQSAVIGGKDDCGYVFIHDIPVDIGRVGDASQQSLIGANKQIAAGDPNSSIADRLIRRNLAADFLCNPIVISGKNAVVTPFVTYKIKNDAKLWDGIITTGDLLARKGSQLLLADGATLKTYSNYLPPAYSIAYAWKKGQQRPYKDAQIVFNYQQPDEYTVTFDAEGKVVLDSELRLKELFSNNRDTAMIEATTKVTGMFPLTELDFWLAGLPAEFGPVTIAERDRPENEFTSTFALQKKDALTMQELDGKTVMELGQGEDVFHFVQNIDTDLYRLKEPCWSSFIRGRDGILLNSHFAHLPVVLMYLELVENNPQEFTREGATYRLPPAARQIMDAYFVSMQDLIDVGIDIIPSEDNDITFTREQRDKLLEIGEQHYKEFSDGDYYEERLLSLLEGGMRKAEPIIPQEVRLERVLTQEERDNMSREERAALVARDIADYLWVDVEDLIAVGVDITDPDVIVTKEQNEALREIYFQREMERFHGLRDVTMAEGALVQTLGYLDLTAPPAEALTDPEILALPQYLWAEVARRVDGQEVISIELIPLTWKESVPYDSAFMGGGFSAESYGKAAMPQMFSKAEPWHIMNPGKFLFSAQLPAGYNFGLEQAGSAVAVVTVRETAVARQYIERARAVEAAIIWALGQSEGQITRGSFQVDPDKEVEIELHFEDPDDRGDDLVINWRSVQYIHITYIESGGNNNPTEQGFWQNLKDDIDYLWHVIKNDFSRGE